MHWKLSTKLYHFLITVVLIIEGLVNSEVVWWLVSNVGIYNKRICPLLFDESPM